MTFVPWLQVSSVTTIFLLTEQVKAAVAGLGSAELKVMKTPYGEALASDATLDSLGIKKMDMLHVAPLPKKKEEPSLDEPAGAKKGSKKKESRKKAPAKPKKARGGKRKSRKDDEDDETEEEDNGWEAAMEREEDDLAPEDRVKFGAHAGPALKNQRATLYSSQGGSAGDIAREFLMAGSEGISGAAAYDQFTAAARVQAATKGSFTIERKFGGGQSVAGGQERSGAYMLYVTFVGDRKKQLEEECPGYSVEMLVAIFTAIHEKRTTSKRRRTSGGVGANDKLLNSAEVAARSPSIFWSTMQHAAALENPITNPQLAISHFVEQAQAGLAAGVEGAENS